MTCTPTPARGAWVACLVISDGQTVGGIDRLRRQPVAGQFATYLDAIHAAACAMQRTPGQVIRATVERAGSDLDHAPRVRRTIARRRARQEAAP